MNKTFHNHEKYTICTIVQFCPIFQFQKRNFSSKLFREIKMTNVLNPRFLWISEFFGEKQNIKRGTYFVIFGIGLKDRNTRQVNRSQSFYL